MLSSTLGYLRCPSCQFPDLNLKATQTRSGKRAEIVTGAITCPECRTQFPILGGVAILVEDVGDYLLSHIKGIAREVPESAFPQAFRAEMIQAKSEIASGHIEEDLESERVTALYVMTQYLAAKDFRGFSGSPEILKMIHSYWDKGPFKRIQKGLHELFGKKRISLVELGCGAGGLLRALSGNLSSYLGADSSFSSIALARRLAFGFGRKDQFKVPQDLLDGTVSRDISKCLMSISAEIKRHGVQADFVVTDATSSALKPGQWDASAALNLIDMLEQPEELPTLQRALVHEGGMAIQSSPYVWHPDTARALRKKFPSAKDSSSVVEKLYERAFQIVRSEKHVPWLFFKHSRQLELYDVHLFFGRK